MALSTYVITSMTHGVTKNAAPLAGSPFASDKLALDAIFADAAGDAGTTEVLVNMQQSAAGESNAFAFSLAEAVAIGTSGVPFAKPVTVAGIVVGGAKPILVGGSTLFNAYVYAAVGGGDDHNAVDIKFQGLVFKNHKNNAIKVNQARHATIQDCEFYQTNNVANWWIATDPNGRTNSYSVGGATHYRMYVCEIGIGTLFRTGNIPPAAFTPTQGIHGDILFQNNIVDISNKDSAGVDFPDGTNFFVTGLYTRSTEPESKVRILNNRVVGCSLRGVSTSDDFGTYEARGNRVESSIFAPKNSLGGYWSGDLVSATPFNISSGFNATRRNLQGYGSFHIEANTFIIKALDGLGASIISRLGWKPGPIAAVKNTFLQQPYSPANKPKAAYDVEGHDNTYFAENVLRGQAQQAILVGDGLSVTLYDTKRAVIEGNELDMTYGASDPYAVKLGAQSWNCSAYGDGANYDYVALKEGQGNRIIGYGALVRL